MRYSIFAMALFLFTAQVCDAAGVAAQPDKTGNQAASALKQAQEAAMPAATQPKASSQTDQGNGVVAATQESDNSGPEQAVYPGVRNRRLESGGDGNPSSALWYPQFGNASVDASLREFVEKAATDYENEVGESIGENGEKPESWSQWEQSGFFTLSRPNPDIASITFNIYNYTGGAHGQIYIIVRNYDLKTGQQLTLGDLFGDVDEALKIMATISASKLREILGEDTDEDMLADGTEPTEANFSALSLTPKGVTVEFQPYQVGPWSIGQQHVDVDLKELAPAKPNPDIWLPHK